MTAKLINRATVAYTTTEDDLEGSQGDLVTQARRTVSVTWMPLESLPQLRGVTRRVEAAEPHRAHEDADWRQVLGTWKQVGSIEGEGCG